MLKLFKELKPFFITILIIIGLLFLQASAELALPDYMSNIVNIGIQQNGIDNTVPEVMKISTMEKVQLFLSQEESNIVNDSYKLISKENLTDKEYEKYLKKYPAIENKNLYILDTDSKEDIEEMNSFLGKYLLIVAGIEKGMPQGVTSGNLENNPFASLPEGVDPYMVLKNLPQEQLDEMKAQIDKQFEGLTESIINQSAINYIKTQYEEIGMDIGKRQTNYIFYTGGIMVLISLASMASTILVGLLSARVSSGLGRNLRDKMFNKVTAFSNGEFDDFSTASLITRSTNDIQQVQMFVIMMLRIVFYAPILGIGGVVRALRTNTSMAWIVAVGVGAILALVIVLFAVAMPKFKSLQKLVDRVNRVMRESLTGMLVIRAFNTERFEEKKFDDANRDLTKTNLFVSRIMTVMMPTMTLILNGITLLIVWIGAHQIDNGVIQVGDMMAFMQYAMQIIMSFLMISMISIILPRASVSAGRIFEVLDKKLTIEDPVSPKELGENVKGVLEFKNVSFKYPGAEEYALENISFTAKPGETTAFIGSTGSGKSTLVNLIPRFYDATEGQILLDGIDIRDIKLHDLREKIGYVPQKGVLFSGTIESNIRYGKNADASDEEISKVIEIAQAKEFISQKEKGIHTEISQGGTNVSGGQRQRLSIARALAKKPQILIFDDSFSALDFKTDLALRKAINSEIKDRTVLIVAQRINTIMNAENIIVLDEGKIVGMGTHKELLQNCSVYRQIALSQLSEEELAI